MSQLLLLLPCLTVIWFLSELCWNNYFKLISYWSDLIASHFLFFILRSFSQVSTWDWPPVTSHHCQFLFYFPWLPAPYCFNDAISNFNLSHFLLICKYLGSCQAHSWLQETLMCYWFLHSHTNHPPKALPNVSHPQSTWVSAVPQNSCGLSGHPPLQKV